MAGKKQAEKRPEKEVLPEPEVAEPEVVDVTVLTRGEIVDLVPQQQELQRLGELARDRVVECLKMGATGRLVVTLDYVNSAPTSKLGVYGHFRQEGYVERDTGERIHQMAINPYQLVGRAPEDIWATFLHECIHWVAASNDIQDTSRQGRYHGAKFRKLAEQVPELSTVKDKKIGTVTMLSEDGRINAREEVQPSAAALAFGKLIEVSDGKKSKKPPVIFCAVCEEFEVKITQTQRKRMFGTPDEVADIHDGILEVPMHCKKPMVLRIDPDAIDEGDEADL